MQNESWGGRTRARPKGFGGGSGLRRLASAATRPLLALMAADTISRLGSSLTAVAIPWFVLVTTGSVARTGAVVFAGGVGVVPALFFGGAVVDRLAYRRASISADLAAAVVVAAIPLLYHTTGLPLALLIPLVLLEALLNTPAQVARYSALPEFAERAGWRFGRANAIFDASLTLAALLGPVLAGLLIALVGAGNVLWLDAASFGASALLLTRVPATLLPPAAPAEHYLRRVVGALRFVAAIPSSSPSSSPSRRSTLPLGRSSRC